MLRAGADGATERDMADVRCPWYSTCSVVDVVPAISYGATAF